MNPKAFYEAHIYVFLAFIPPMGAIVDDHNPLTGNSGGIRHFDFIIKESNPEKKNSNKWMLGCASEALLTLL